MNIIKYTPLILLLTAAGAFADTTVDQLLKSRFSGAGKIINLFAGKAAKEGLKTRTAVSGERRAAMTGRDIEVIDLSEEKIWRYSVSRKGKPKKCRVTTFDEFREQLAVLEDLPFFGGGAHEDAALDNGAQLPEYEVTLKFTETGEQETHAGVTGDVMSFAAIAHRPGLSVDEGGAILETTFVVGPKSQAWTEMQAWNLKWAGVIGEMTGMGANLNNLLASSPALQEVMAELRSKEEKLDGTLLRVSTRLWTVRDPRAEHEAPADANADGDISPTRLGARLGRALFKKKRDASAAKGPRELYSSEIVITGLSDTADPILQLPDKCPD